MKKTIKKIIVDIDYIILRNLEYRCHTEYEEQVETIIKYELKEKLIGLKFKILKVHIKSIYLSNGCSSFEVPADVEIWNPVWETRKAYKQRNWNQWRRRDIND